MRLTDKKRLEVLSYKHANKSYRFIAKTIGISPSTVSNIIRKFTLEGSMDDKPRSGRPRKATIHDDRLICLTARRKTYKHYKIMVEK